MAIEPLSEPTATAPTPQLFLLRVWPGKPGFCAVLRQVGGAEPGSVFSQPEQLAEYLRRLRPAATTDDQEDPR